MIGPKIKVMVRLRPPDRKDPRKGDMIQLFPKDNQKMTITNPFSRGEPDISSFEFDRSFNPSMLQEDVFHHVFQPQVEHVLTGLNACWMFYGPSKSGKTYTAFGNGQAPGLLQQGLDFILAEAREDQYTRSITVTGSFYDIYKDQVHDLGKAYIDSNATYLEPSTVQAEGRKATIPRITSIPLTTSAQATEIVEKGLALRRSMEHTPKEISIHSSTVFSLTITTQDLSGQEAALLNVLNLVILPCQDSNQRDTKMTHNAFHNVIQAVATQQRFGRQEDCLLSRLIESSLIGGSYTTLLAWLNPSELYYENCLASLQYANNCMFVQTKNRRYTYIDPTTFSPEAQEEKIKSLSDEIFEYKRKLEDAQLVIELKGKEIVSTMGLGDLDPDRLIRSKSGSREWERVKLQKDSVSNLDKLSRVNKDLEKKLEEQQQLFEEMKRFDLLNSEKHTREVIELKDSISYLRDNIQIDKQHTEHSVKSTLEVRTEELQRMLTHSHALLEEKNAVINNLPFTMKYKQNDQSQMQSSMSNHRNVGAYEAEKKYTKMFQTQEKNNKREMQTLKEQYEYQINEKNDEIVRLQKEFAEFNELLPQNEKEIDNETLTLYDTI